MSHTHLIAPSILSADFSRLAGQISDAEDAGADWIHIDVMDGHFVPNITMGPFIVETVRKISDLPLDVHLMIEHPERYIQDFANAGADYLTVHIEANPHIHRTLQQIHNSNCKAGVSLNPGTPAVSIQEVLGIIDLCLVMSVNPGYSGQKFIESVVPKIAQIREMISRTNSQALIEVDGGIDKSTLPSVLQAGAQVFVAASAVFRHPLGIHSGVRDLRAAIQSAVGSEPA